MRYLAALAMLLLVVPDALAQAGDSVAAAERRHRAYDQLERARVPLEKESLHDRCLVGDSASVRSLVYTGMIPVNLIRNDRTPLQLASSVGELRCVAVLLDLGADAEYDPALRGTPIALAAEGGHLGVVRRLLRHGVSLKPHPLTGASPLDYAAQGNHLSVMEALLDAGSNPAFALVSVMQPGRRRTFEWLLQRSTTRNMEMAALVACSRGPTHTSYLNAMRARGFTESCEGLQARMQDGL